MNGVGDLPWDDLPWDGLPLDGLEGALTREGYVVLPGVLDVARVRRLAALVDAAEAPRTLDAAAARTATRALDDEASLEPLASLRRALYPRLAKLANQWHATMELPTSFPPTLDAHRDAPRSPGPSRSLAVVERLAAPARRPLHDDPAGAQGFPVQLSVLLSTPGVDFTGGELVMVEQRPRMQSRAIVVPLTAGDVAVVATAKRPVQGREGAYAVRVRHAVGRVRQGVRVDLRLWFPASPGG